MQSKRYLTRIRKSFMYVNIKLWGKNVGFCNTKTKNSKNLNKKRESLHLCRPLNIGGSLKPTASIGFSALVPSVHGSGEYSKKWC